MYWKLLNLARQVKFTYKEYEEINTNSIKLFWWKESHNFGDALNYDLATRITTKQVEWVPFNYSKEHYLAIGSILQKANRNSIIWGSGFIDNHLQPYRKPREVLAVRGPLSRKRLLDLGIPCPEIYGDPALIMPELYYPKYEKKFELGIIPHYTDKRNDFFNQTFSENIKIIDVEQSTSTGFIQDILSCKKIITSSLHGLVISDAYDIPALRVNFSQKIYGGDFKFHDYFLSIAREITPAIQITTKSSPNEIMGLNYKYSKNIKTQALMRCNPFN